METVRDLPLGKNLMWRVDLAGQSAVVITSTRVAMLMAGEITASPGPNGETASVRWSKVAHCMPA